VGRHDLERFADLTFDDFRRMAGDDSLSQYEKIGFPDEYRADAEEGIFRDIAAKLELERDRGLTVLDIGPGCSELPRLISALASKQGHRLLLVDSPEMLAQLPDEPHVTKIAGHYPHAAGLTPEHDESVDALLAYSVLHYVFAEGSTWDFLDRSLELLAPGGVMLIGDIPNVSKRRRFFSSAAGIAYHQAFTGDDAPPRVDWNVVERGRIDDAVVLSLLARARAAGFDAYVLPQAEELPMANRREDILIRRP
jgi:cyclopropane fatty-acyl-phospholipid synthase-like methyltransferase